MGLMNAGISELFAVEKNTDAFNTLKYNLIDSKKHFTWPKSLEVKPWNIIDLIETQQTTLSALAGTIDLVAGGPPCQGFSMAGLRQQDDVRNQLMHYYLKFVDIVQPNMLFFENVHGFTVPFKDTNGEKGEPYSKVLQAELAQRKYFSSFRIIDMSEFGVPQNRRRFVLFASKDPLQPDDFFTKLYANRTNFLKKRKLKTPITLSQAIGDLQRASGEIQSIDTPGFMNGLYGSPTSNYQRLMRKHLAKDAIPDSHRFAKHRNTTIEIFKQLMKVSTNQIRVTPAMKLVPNLKKRGVTPLKTDEICPTLTSIPDDFVHFSDPRIMTVREYARIQSFPDDFVFLGPYTTGGIQRKNNVPRYTQVANAVPPLFAEQVGNVILSLNEERR